MEGAFLVFLDPHVPLLLGLVLAALVLFVRWQETGDRSAYAMGAVAAVLAPVWILGMLVVHFVFRDRSPLPTATGHLDPFPWVIAWTYWILGLVVVLALLWFTLRPLWLTGGFLSAPQSEVRKRFKSLETSWQFALGTLVAAKGLVLVFLLLERWI